MNSARDRSAAYFACFAVGAVIISACSGGGGSASPALNADPRDGSSLVRQAVAGQTTTIPVASTKLPVVMLGNVASNPVGTVSLASRRAGLSVGGAHPLVGPQVLGGPLITDLAHTGNLHNPDVLLSSGTNVWVGEQASNAIVEINTPQDTSASYPLQSGHNVGGLVFDASQQLWFSDPAKSMYGYMTTANKITEVTLPSPHGSGIMGTVRGPNNDIYFGSPGSNEIIQVAPSNPAVYNFVSIGSSYSPKYGVSTAGYLFFTSNGTLIRYGFTNGAITSANTYPINAGDTWGPIVVGTDGNLYIADQTQKSVLKITLSLGTPATVSDLGVNYVPTGLSAEAGDNDIWVALPSANQINALNFAVPRIDLTITPPSAGSLPTSVITLGDDKANAGITAQAAAALSHHGPVAETFIADRVPYAAALTDGRSAMELSPKGPAAIETAGLWKNIKTCLHVSMKKSNAAMQTTQEVAAHA